MACFDHFISIEQEEMFSSDHFISIEQGDTELEFDHFISIEQWVEFEDDHFVSIQQFTATVFEQFFAPTLDGRLYRTYGWTLELVNVGDDTIDLTPYVKSWSINEARNNPSSASFVLRDEERLFRPKLLDSDPFFQRLDGDSFDESYTLKRYLRFRILAAGEVYEAPWFLIVDYDWKLTPTEVLVTLSCGDLSELLLANEDDAEDDFLSETGSVVYAHQIVATILQNRGISNYRLEFTDFPISHFSPKGGTAMDWIRQVLDVMRAEWFWDVDTFVARDPSYLSEGPGEWNFEDIFDLKSLSWKKSIRELKNEVLVRKTEKAGNIVGDFEEFDGEALGITDFLPIDPPVTLIQADILTAVFGEINTITYYDQNKNPLNVLTPSGTIASSPSGIYFTRFIYEPSPEPWPAGLRPHYHVQFTGKSKVQEPSFPQGDLDYQVLVINQASQNRFGKRREFAPVENTLIPGKEVATIHGVRYLEEKVRMTNVSNWAGQLNPFVRPAMTIGITAGFAGYITPGFFYIESVAKQGDANSATMNLECTIYEPG